MFVLRSKINFFQRILIVYIFGFFSLVTTATEINLEPNLSVESCIDKWTEKGLLNARTFYYCMSKHTEEFTEPLYHYKKYSNLELRIEAFSYTSMFEKEQFNYKELPGTSIFLENEVIVTGDNIIKAKSSFDENGWPQIHIELDIDGAQAISNATKNNIGRKLAVLLIEEITKTSLDENGDLIQEKEIVKQVISSATIQAVLGARFRITGLNSIEESNELATQLNGGKS